MNSIAHFTLLIFLIANLNSVNGGLGSTLGSYFDPMFRDKSRSLSAWFQSLFGGGEAENEVDDDQDHKGFIYGNKRRQFPNECNIHEVIAFCGSRCWQMFVKRRVARKLFKKVQVCLAECVQILKPVKCIEKAKRKRKPAIIVRAVKKPPTLGRSATNVFEGDVKNIFVNGSVVNIE